MKIKIVSISVCMLLIATALPTIGSIQGVQKNEKQKINIPEVTTESPEIETDIFFDDDCGCFKNKLEYEEKKMLIF